MFQCDVAHRYSAARLEHAGNLTKYRGLVRREIQDAVGDDAINRRIRQWNLVDGGLIELDIGVAARLGICSRTLNHGRRHIYADGTAFRANHLRRQEHVEPSAGAEIDHNLTGSDVCRSRGIATRQAHIGFRRNRRKGSRINNLNNVPMQHMLSLWEQRWL